MTFNQSDPPPGVKFSWMLGFVVIRGKKIVVKSSPVKSKPHRAMASSFEVETMIRGYHQYKAVWGAQVGEQLQCRREMSNPHDIYAVAILKSGVVVGYVPPKTPPSVLRFCDVEGQFKAQ